MNPDIISENDHILLKMPSDNAKIIVAKSNTMIELGKFGRFNINDLLGQYYGMHYEIETQGLVAIKNNNFLNDFDTELTTADDNSNQLIEDVRTKQKLSHSEIEALKLESLQGKHHNVIQIYSGTHQDHCAE